uniref:retention module-containing protein n=1 Tax=uncultured Gilvimarinus sp. TaxID=1689143 RepID=UPI0030EF7DA0
MATQAATVSVLQGRAWARAEDGSLRELAVGDVIAADERLVTEAGTRIELDFGDAAPVTLSGVQDVAMSPDLWPDTAAARDEASVLNEQFDAILAGLDENDSLLLGGDGDLLDMLDQAPAAGQSTSGGGHSFVRVERINETVDGQSYEFAAGSRAEATTAEADDFAVNNAPTTADQSLSTGEDTPVLGQISAQDLDGDSLSYTLTQPPANGSVTLNPATGEFEYTPNADFNGADEFTVTVSDGTQSAVSVAQVDVIAVNDAPVAQDQTVTTPEDTPLAGQVDASDVDLGDTLTYALDIPPANGSVTLDPDTGAFTYTPNENYNGPDSFNVIVTDNSGATDTATVQLSVTPVNDAPNAVDDGPLETFATTTVTGNALDNDSDLDGDNLQVVGFSVADNDTVFAPGDEVPLGDAGVFGIDANGEFYFTPSDGYSGPVPEVSYTVSDGSLTDSAAIRFDDVPGGVAPPPPPPPVEPPAATIALDNITSDNIISAAEAAGNVVVTGQVGGDAQSGDTITLTVNGNDYTGTVLAGGGFSIAVAGADLAAANVISASVDGTSDSGQSYSATTSAGYSVDTQAPQVAITLDEQITPDDIINAQEAGQTIAITGAVSGDVSDGDLVTVTVNDVVYTGEVTGGAFSIDVAGSDLVADADNQIEASITTSTGDVNGEATATDSEGYAVDTELPVVSITLDEITDTDAIAIAAANGENTTVTGSVSGDVVDGDIVEITIGGNTYSGQVDGGTFAIDVAANDFVTDADASVAASITVQDTAGNSASASDDADFILNPVNVAQFTDNFVNGVSFTTSSGLSGITGEAGADGSFYYRAGDTITFTVGDVTVAEFSADAIVGNVLFLQDIAGTALSDSNSNYVENMAIFLQALDNDLTDSTPNDGILQTNDLQNNQASYESNITITPEIRDAFANYIDPTTGAPLNIATAGKEMISQALASVGIEFTRDSERDPSGDNVFETIAMEHVAVTIEELAGDRGPVTADERTEDVLDVPGGLIQYNYNELNGEITFNTDDLLEGAVGRQVITENLLVSNVQLSASYTDIGVLEDRGNGEYAIVLSPDTDQYDLEGLSIDYRVEDWTVFRDVTSATQDQYRSHLSADIQDVGEGDGFNQFTLNSELVFDTDSSLLINFTSELLSDQLGYPIAEYADDYLVPLEYSNDGGQTWQQMQLHSTVNSDSGLPRPIFEFVLGAGDSSVEIRVPIFDDAIIEDPIEYFDAVVSGDNVYDEHLQFGIIDNDAQGQDLPLISLDYVLVVEGDGDAVFTLTLSEPSTETVTVAYQTADQGALAGEDYTAVQGVAVFAPGQTSVTVTVPVIDDDIIESQPNPEFALLNLSNPTNAALADSQGTLRIFDNDTPDNAAMTLDIDPVTGDNLIDASEAGSMVTLTGTVTADPAIGFSLVTITVNGQSYQAVADSNGRFSVQVPGQGLIDDADTTVTGRVIGVGADGAQGSANASEAYAVDLSAPTILINDLNGELQPGEASVTEASGTTVNGTINVQAVAGIAAVTIAGFDITGASNTPVTINSPQGQLLVTGYDAATGVISYQFTESGSAADHTAGDVVDSFEVRVTDTASVTVSDNLDVYILDTAPTAEAANISIAEDGTQVIGGVTIAAGADTFNVDVQNNVAGNYGQFSIDASGQYTYVLNGGQTAVQQLDDGEQLQDSFTYNVTDSDGNVSSNTVTVTINGATDAAPVIVVTDSDGQLTPADNSVTEATGSTVVGSASVSAEAGITSVTVDGQDISAAGTTPVVITTANGSLTITNYDSATGVISYQFVENNTAVDHSVGDVIDTVVIAVTDVTGTTTNANLDIQILDTAPAAVDDADTVVLGGSTSGNVITGAGADTLGADGASLNQVSYGGVTYDSNSAEFNGSTWTIAATNGVLQIDTQGNYTYTSNATAPAPVNTGGGDAASWSGVALYGFAASGDAYTDSAGNLNPAVLDAAHAGNVVFAQNQVGVRVGAGDISTIDSSDNNGPQSQALILDLGTSASQANVLFGQVGSTDDGRWVAYDENFNEVGSGSFDVLPYSVHVEPGASFQYLVISGADTDDHFSVHSVDYIESAANPADEAFGYQLIDADGSVSNEANLVINHDLSVTDGNESIAIGENDNIGAGEFNLLDNSTPNNGGNVITSTGDESIIINNVDLTHLFTISATGFSYGQAEFTITHKETGFTGVFTLNSDGNLTFDNGLNPLFDFLNEGDQASINVDYIVNGSIQSTLTINVAGAEDAAVIGGVSTGTVAEDGTQTASGALSISDVDSSDNPVSFADVASTAGDNAYGSFVLSGGSWTYTLDNAAVQFLDANESVTDSITYTATDGSSQTITVTINGAEDAAVIGGVSTGTVAE